MECAAAYVPTILTETAHWTKTPPEDLDGDGNILQMRVRDEMGTMITSPDDRRLMVPAEAGEKGEWRIYSEGIDNDNDGRFNEDGVGGLDINRNWPGQWHRNVTGLINHHPETRAVAEFLFSQWQATSSTARPPTALHFNPVTGVEEPMAAGDESIFEFFGSKYTEFING